MFDGSEASESLIAALQDGGMSDEEIFEGVFDALESDDRVDCLAFVARCMGVDVPEEVRDYMDAHGLRG